MRKLHVLMVDGNHPPQRGGRRVGLFDGDRGAFNRSF